jgi:hypothetical protein
LAIACATRLVRETQPLLTAIDHVACYGGRVCKIADARKRRLLGMYDSVAHLLAHLPT